MNLVKKTYQDGVLAFILLIGLIANQGCKKNVAQQTDPSSSEFLISGETITLAAEKANYFLKKDAKIKSVYKITENNKITTYKAGTDYVINANGSIQRTALSTIPDFSKYKVIMKPDGKFSFMGAPRNPPATIEWQVMVNYTTKRDSVITSKSSFLSAKLQNKLKAKEDISLYCIGTSITQGAHTVPLFYDGKNTGSYATLIARAITKIYGCKVTLTNLANGGATTALFTSRLNEIKLARPDLIFVEFGMNEHTTPSAIPDNLDMIEKGLKDLLSDNINCALIGFFQQNSLWEAEDPAYTVSFNNSLKNIAQRNNVFFADIYSAFQKIPTNKLYTDIMGDYMHHPTDFGHQIYYLSIAPLIISQNEKESALLKAIQN